MKEFQEKYGNWAMVVGAAVGLGEAFCSSLAEKGINLVMIDNQKDKLNHLSNQLIQKFEIKTHAIHLDLSDSESNMNIIKETAKLEIRLLIYVAAFSKIKKFEDFTSDELDQFINVNTRTPIKLVHAFSKNLINKQLSGGILLMSSLSGLLGMQLIAPYAASKAFLWNLSESLHHELKHKNIDLMACVAGATATEAYLSTKPKYGIFKPQVQQPKDVADLALKNMGRKNLYIPGFWNRFHYFILLRLLPRKIAASIANRTMRSMYPNV